MSGARHHQVFDNAAFKVLNRLSVALDDDRARGYDCAVNRRQASPTAKHTEGQERNAKALSRRCAPIARRGAIPAPCVYLRQDRKPCLRKPSQRPCLELNELLHDPTRAKRLTAIVRMRDEARQFALKSCLHLPQPDFVHHCLVAWMGRAGFEKRAWREPPSAW